MKSGISILILICLQMATTPPCLCEKEGDAGEALVSTCCLRSAPAKEESSGHEECPDCPHCAQAGNFVSDSPGNPFLPPEALSLDSLAPAPRFLSVTASPSGMPTRAILHPWNPPLCSLLENRAHFGVFLI